MKELSYLNKYFSKYKRSVIFGVIIVMFAKIFSLFPPRLIGDVITIVANQLENPVSLSVFKQTIALKIIFILFAAIITGIFTFLMRQTLINVSRYIEFDLKNEIYEHYQKLSLNFYKKNRTGDLMSRISEDVGKVRMYVGPALMYTINTITLFIVIIIYMYNKAPLLTLYTILPLPILSISIYFLSKLINKQSTIVQKQLSALSSLAQEIFSGIRVTKSYVVEDKMKNDFTQYSVSQMKKKLNLSKIQAFFYPLMLFLIGSSNLIVIYIGGKQYIAGQIQELGVIAEFIIYVNMLTWPVASIGWVTSLVQEAEASQKRINEFLKQKVDISSTENLLSNIEGKICFKNVSMKYEDTKIMALKNISFTLEIGTTLAIIGKTGSGKSTILELVGRLHDTTNGTIEVDDISIKKLDLQNLRNSIGYVPQDPFLFSDSIQNNIKFGKKDAICDEITIAAKKSAVHNDIIKFKDGYRTVLGERGITLSGGQKQRISIARALIKNPQILLLDDCLSAVDTETEEIILNNLKSIMEDKTTIIASHRISSVKNADKILVLDNGEVVQQGKHFELIKQDGLYKELFKKQLKDSDKL